MEIALNQNPIFDSPLPAKIESRSMGLKLFVVCALALAMTIPAYSLIFMLLRLEDNALLVGAIASFVAVAAAMYFTRSIDWYGSFPETARPTQ